MKNLVWLEDYLAYDEVNEKVYFVEDAGNGYVQFFDELSDEELLVHFNVKRA